MTANLIAEIAQLRTDCVRGYLIFEGKNYSDRIAIIGFLFWLSCNTVNKHINDRIYEANWIIKSAEDRALLGTFLTEGFCRR